VRIFVLDYARIVKPINLFLKKDQIFELSEDIQRSFNNIKHAISTIPLLIRPILINILSYTLLPQNKLLPQF
jgi:hypothetical protein